MRIIEKTAYTAKELKELFPKAFEKAHYNFQKDESYDNRDNEATIKAFIDALPYIWLRRDEIAVTYGVYNLTEIEELTGEELYSFLKVNDVISKFTKGEEYTNKNSNVKRYSCPLTGYCMDDVFLDPFWEWLNDYKNSPLTYGELVRECYQSGQKAIQADYDYYFSEENFIEMSEINEWEYFKDSSFCFED